MWSCNAPAVARRALRLSGHRTNKALRHEGRVDNIQVHGIPPYIHHWGNELSWAYGHREFNAAHPNNQKNWRPCSWLNRVYSCYFGPAVSKCWCNVDCKDHIQAACVMSVCWYWYRQQNVWNGGTSFAKTSWFLKWETYCFVWRLRCAFGIQDISSHVQ